MEYEFPLDLKYTHSHEWVKIENDIAIVGITDYAQDKLSDIVYVEFPQKGEEFEKGSVVGEFESVKAVDEFYMPLSGKIVELNTKLTDNPELINSSPYNEGWILKIRFKDPSELDAFLSVKEYQELIIKEEDQ
ncbi:MAG: glycine cleavage system protein GcvH [Promethearchaeota archaeon]|nr:MAG: glycine cleavage system protein GcvH [Candidatus Lokiarchaeota archaeon]